MVTLRIDDGKSKYMEQSTLLEPANNNGAKWEDEEEMREISGSLAKIKKKHDVVKKQVIAMEDQLDRVKKEIEQLNNQEKNAENAVYMNSAKVQQLEEAIATTKAKIEEEGMHTHFYGQMVDRIKKDQVASEISKKDLESAIRKKEIILAEENEKQRKMRETQLQSKHVFDNLMQNIGDEQTDRKRRIQNMNRSIRNKEENVLRREAREKHQRDIAESAANENRDANEKQMRNNFMIHKLVNSFMRKKMELEMKNSVEIDDAFKRIKTATGVSDV